MNQITQEKLKEMLILGGENLTSCYETINSLNVFPVPDGDTGTNMNMTIQSGIKAISTTNTQTPFELTKTFSKGLLLGARGNSGVILSQFFRGFSEGMEKVDEINVSTFQKSLKSGEKKAYGSVIKAVEGTILTVIKDMANFKTPEKDFIKYFDDLLKVAQKSLENTPNLLPVLKEAGVVDSGGAGLLEIFKGMQASLTGKEIKNTLGNNFELFRQTEEHPLNIEDITFGYCTEMLIKLNKDIDLSKVREYLEKLGDSIVAIEDDGILKVHIHTEEPQEVFTYGKSMGDFIHIKSENMRMQALEANNQKEEVENGIVVVCSSQEMAKLFSSIHDIEPIIGGQTLNPSIEDIVKSIEKTNAKNIIILPNNSNILLASEGAKKIVKNKNIEIIKTKHMTEGLESLINYDPNLNITENTQKINDNLKKLINYEVTNAIKDTKINNVEIKKDDFLIIKNGEIVNSVNKEEEVFKYIESDLNLDDIEILTTLIGRGGNEKLIQNFNSKIEEINEFLETKTYATKQPVYQYLISALKE